MVKIRFQVNNFFLIIIISECQMSDRTHGRPEEILVYTFSRTRFWEVMKMHIEEILRIIFVNFYMEEQIYEHLGCIRPLILSIAELL